MNEIKKDNFKIHAYLKEAKLVKADNDDIVIGFPKQCNFHRRMFDDDKNKRAIEDSIRKITGVNAVIKMIILGENDNCYNDSGVVDDKKNDNSNNGLIQDLLNNPIIRKVQEEFDARVIRTEED